ncbi:hypothetical protein FHG64_14985 [Antarcticibacterium flavum]|uniref:Addiction module protein n=1 Tax=Antarcticibacterium flavum TaxID=2058175 RepID=A0A5B7X5G7_9FLAO|nr:MULTISPECIES: hypothetical protein [Antarcticibacterium]MCM4161372.1 hypothetical protein [Antarcticibacterium sp. W02-3]QCY70599.1 hypothetical protein FHG64_14985 [Antarcticibacterium flavum]
MKLKDRIIQKIENLRDEESLLQLERWLDAISAVDETFSREEINSVMEGYSQYENSELMDQEEVNRSFEEWSRGK